MTTTDTAPHGVTSSGAKSSGVTSSGSASFGAICVGAEAAPAEVREFASTVRRVLLEQPTPDNWTPGAPSDDRTTALETQLGAIGWFDVVTDASTIDFVGPAALELGRGLAPVSTVDAALRAAIGVSSVRSVRPKAAVPQQGSAVLVRYPTVDGLVLLASPEGIVAGASAGAQPIGYIDSWAVHTVDLEPGPVEANAQGRPEDWISWCTAMTGYLAGLVLGAQDLVLEHVRTRIAFGRPLIEVESVSNMMADVLTTSAGLSMAADRPGTQNTLRFAGPAAVRALAQCHQMMGAIGFTTEFPLHRYSRRAKALSSWNDEVLDALDALDAQQLAAASIVPTVLKVPTGDER